MQPKSRSSVFVGSLKLSWPPTSRGGGRVVNRDEIVALASLNGGRGTTIRCQAHNDRNPSLSISSGDEGRILVNCHAGCAPETVVAALGLTLADLMADIKPKESRKGGAGRIVATYDYTDEAGKLLYQVVRFDPKDFRQRRPDGNGGWTWKLDSVKQVPYRLPVLLAAELEEAVIVCEGEKDCDALAALDITTTTNSGGAGRWRPEFAAHLKGRDVIIIPDNDSPGRRHAQDVARSLHGVAKSVRVLELPGLPEKGDVSDWLADGHTVAELAALAEGACEWSPAPAAPSTGQVPATEDLLEALVAFIHRFVILTPAQATVAALWTLHTHAIDAAEVTLFLSVSSAEMASGKTRLLEVLALLVRKAWRAVFPSEAVLYRKIQADCPTLLLDEVDGIFGNRVGDHEGLRAVLNAGNRRGVMVPRCVGKSADMKLQTFSVFCARALAGIGRLPATVADRSIPVRLKRRTPGEKIAPFRFREVEPEAAELRARLETWAPAVLDVLKNARPFAPPELDDRTADGAEPLLAIADLASGEWPARARAALVTLARDKTADDDSLGLRLLKDCKTAFGELDRISSANLCETLVRMEESPWPEVSRNAKPLTVRKLASLLNAYDIVSGTVRFPNASVGSPTTAKGYYRAAFEDAWSRFLPSATLPTVSNVTTSQACTGAVFPPISNRHAGSLVTDEKRDFVNTGASCDAVTDVELLGQLAAADEEIL